MAAIITIWEYPTMRGRYLYSLKAAGERTINGLDAGDDAGAAAAFAMQLAIRYDSYAIFAPEKVLAHIPERFRNS